MYIADDNVTPLPTLLERIAIRAAQAMDEYKAGEADQSKGRQRSVHALIAYGRALLEGREGGIKGRSNQAFGQWVTDNKLDVGKPWDNRAERHAAMKIAEIVVGSAPDNAFDECPNTRPADIMKWYRKTHPGKTDKPKRANARKPSPAEARAAAVENLDGGKSREQVAAKHNLGEHQVQLARKELMGERAAFEKLLDAAGAEHFVDKGKLRVEDAIRIHKARLDKQFEQRVNDEVRRRIDTADDALRQNHKRLHHENIGLQRIIGQRGVFTEKQYRQLLMLCHPDDSASPELKSELLQVLVKNKVHLIKPEKESKS